MNMKENPFEPNHPAAGNAAVTFQSHCGRHWRGVPEPGRSATHCMKPSLLAAVLLMLLVSPSFGRERGLEFLSHIPELRDLSLKMSEDQLKSHVEKHQLYAKKTLEKERVTYWLLTPGGENVFVGFVSGKCTGIQRMQPIPKGLIKDEIGAPAYRAWMAKRKAEPEGGANGSQPSRSDTNSAPPAAGSRR